ncbi:MAG TPA: metallophosphoesterase [Verrucomicrobiae bacterium]|nr:metallophosphoesterase [Verrucomicrobiae bacterium]
MPQRKLKQFRSKQASLWQSAVDRATADTAGSSPAAGFDDSPAPAGGRTAPQDEQTAAAVQAADTIAAMVDQGQTPEIPPPPSEAAGLGDTVAFCSRTAFRIAQARVKSIITGDTTELKALQEEIGAKFGGCDPMWAETITEYVKNRVASVHIPYRHYTSLDDYVISGPRFPDNARVAILGDWGTGDAAARGVLKQIAAKDPDVVIHLGDVYYSGTDHEFQNYFYPIWRDELGLPDVPWGGRPANLDTRPSTFTLAGNHDMYAGGAPYYTAIDMLGQPASYFCLRNSDWQFIALDTGLHDADPTAASTNVTFLEPTEVEWLKHKMATAGGRKTILLSHHQLFTAFDSEKIGGGFLNQKLLDATSDILPQVAAWLWGHEHNLVVFENDPKLKVLARCIGHGAFPVGRDELGALNPDFPITNVKLALDKTGGLFQHGYVMVQLNGSSAALTYYQYDADTGAEIQIFSETL